MVEFCAQGFVEEDEIEVESVAFAKVGKKNKDFVDIFFAWMSKDLLIFILNGSPRL